MDARERERHLVARRRQLCLQLRERLGCELGGERGSLDEERRAYRVVLARPGHGDYLREEFLEHARRVDVVREDRTEGVIHIRRPFL